MKVHQLPPTFWDQHEPSLTLGGHCKRLRPLAPKFSSPNTDDLKSFIRPENHPKKLHSPEEDKKVSPQVETHLGGTRWNPTQEQIKILEMLYKSGIRTPNAQQIEQITEQLGNYGKIEGKNVFYWFQNHKARERQKQKRNNLTPIRQSQETNYSSSPISTISLSLDTTRVRVDPSLLEESPYKKKCRSWSFEEEESKVSCEDSGSAAILAPSVDYYGKDVETLASQLIFPNHGLIVPNIKTLELFPLHPEGR